MNKECQKIKSVMEKELEGSAHHIDHVLRVLKNARLIADSEKGVDMDFLEPAALLHDVARAKEDADASGQIDHAVLGAEMAANILYEMGLVRDRIEKIAHCILTHRFRSDNKPCSIEEKILFDADKLDLTGAIGIARTFMIAGQFKQSIMDCVEIETYQKENLRGGNLSGRIIDKTRHSPLIEFRTKICKFGDILFTEKGRSMAKQRIALMDNFFSALNSEIKAQTED